MPFKVALRVGPHNFSADDLDLRRRIIQFKYPTADSAKLLEQPEASVSGEGRSPLLSADPSTPDPRWERYERELFQPTRVGQWVNHVVTFPEGFELLRWTGIEKLSFPKRDAHTYFHQEVSNIPLWIAESALRNALKLRKSWMRGLSWEDL